MASSSIMVRPARPARPTVTQTWMVTFEDPTTGDAREEIISCTPGMFYMAAPELLTPHDPSFFNDDAEGALWVRERIAS
ncbi:MAG: hypothetical protein PVI21_02955 [Candidatus Woesebacteria bacterium]